MKRYSYTTEIGELEVEFSYSVLWGAPEQGQSYASGGQPADPDEIDDIRVERVNGKYVSEDSCIGAIGNYLLERDLEKMLEEAIEQDYDERCEAMEARAEREPSYE